MDLIDEAAKKYGSSREDLRRRWDRIMSEREKRSFFSQFAPESDFWRCSEFASNDLEYLVRNCQPKVVRSILGLLADNFEANLIKVSEAA